ncbi:MAG TPA: PQQ-binding-like beta-propeller repeat protein [Thermoanaerobaculia bacterium]|nr:PQQ-binding-like beta-propeller repeat protein [Thermoanaerobaculia bacterium]
MFSTPAVAGNLVFVGSCGGTFYALERESGKVRWFYDTRVDGPPAQFHGDALITEELVVVGTDVEPQGCVYAFSRQTGDVHWKEPLAGGAMSDVVRHGNEVLVVSMRGDVVSLDLATGRRNWTFDKAPRTPAGERPPGSPALSGDRLFFAARTGEIYALDVASGRLIWKRDLGTDLNTSMTLSGDALYIGGTKGHIYRLSSATGAVQATAEVDGAAYGTIVATGECILTQSTPDTMACLDPALRGVRWRQRAPREWSAFKPLVWHGVVLTGSPEGEIAGFRLTDGAEVLRLHVDGVVRGLGLSDDRNLLVGTLRGMLYAVPLPDPAALAAAPPHPH